MEGQARSILIVGGGTAGWLTAAYLARFLGPETRITLLEDPAIGAIGGAAASLAKPMSDSFTIPGIPSEQAMDLQQELFPDADDPFETPAGTVVVVAPEGEQLSDPANAAIVEDLIADLREVPQSGDPEQFVNPVAADQGMTHREFASAMGTAFGGSTMWKHAPSRQRMARVAEVLGDAELEVLATNDIYWDSITSVEAVGQHAVYDDRDEDDEAGRRPQKI